MLGSGSLERERQLVELLGEGSSFMGTTKVDIDISTTRDVRRVNHALGTNFS